MMTEEDPCKYLIRRDNLYRLPRWPNDGIDQHRQGGQFFTGGHGQSSCPQPSSRRIHPIQRQITKLLGEWPHAVSLNELQRKYPDDYVTISFVTMLPYTIQAHSANEQQDLEAAKKHLIQAYVDKNEKVRKLLETIGAKSAVHKASRDASRFPELEAIIVPLLHKRLASDTNVDLLFGRVSHVRGLLLEHGPNVAHPPPRNSPAHAFLQQYMGNSGTVSGNGSKAKAAPKICAECGDTTATFLRCAGCKSIHYCSKNCQNAAWVIHKPDCLEARKQNVSDAVLAAADAAIQAKHQAAAEQKEQR